MGLLRIRNTYSLLFLFLLSSLINSGFANTDSLYRVAYNENTSLERRFKAFENLAREVLYKNRDECLKYSNDLKNLAIEKKSKFYQAKADVLIAYNYLLSSEYISARRSLNTAIHIGDSIQSLEILSTAYNGLGILETDLGNFDEANTYLGMALDAETTLNDPKEKIRLAGINHSFASLAMQRGGFAEAIIYYFELLNHLDSIIYIERIALIKSSIAGCYNGIKDYSSALRYATEAEDILRTNSNVELTVALNNKGESLLNLGRIEQAKETYLEAIELNSKEGNQFGLSYSYHGLANTYFKLEDYKSALEYHFKAVAIEEAEGMKNELGNSYSSIGTIYMKQGKRTLASQYLLKGETLSIKVGALDEAFKSRIQRIENDLMVKGLGIIASEFKEAIGWNDTLYSNQRVTAMREMDVKYQQKQKDNQITRQELEIQLREKESRQRLFISIAIGLIAILFIILAFFANRNRQISQKHNQELIDKNNQITLLNEDIEHRTVNHLKTMMVLIESDIEDVDDRNTQSILFNQQHRLQAVSSIHSQLQQNQKFKTVLLNKYLLELCNYLQDFYEERYENIHIQFKPQNKLIIDALDTTNIGIIVTELVTNAVKHAFLNQKNPKVEICLFDYEESVVLTVQDNGIGLPQSGVEYNTKGINLVKAFVERLHGKIELKNSNGLFCRIQFQPKYLSYVSSTD